jgi:hypothetical protein
LPTITVMSVFSLAAGYTGLATPITPYLCFGFHPPHRIGETPRLLQN